MVEDRMRNIRESELMNLYRKNILNFHKIMNHASRKQGIKNYQIQPFSRVDTK